MLGISAKTWENAMKVIVDDKWYIMIEWKAYRRKFRP